MIGVGQNGTHLPKGCANFMEMRAFLRAVAGVGTTPAWPSMFIDSGSRDMEGGKIDQSVTCQSDTV